MDEDEDRKPKLRREFPRDLAPLSRAALHAYLAELEDEIARVKREMAAKHGMRRDAEDLFGKG